MSTKFENVLEAMNEALAGAETQLEQDLIAEQYDILIGQAEKQMELDLQGEFKANDKLLQDEFEAMVREIKLEADGDGPPVKPINDANEPEKPDFEIEIDKEPDVRDFSNIRAIIESRSPKSAARKLIKSDVVKYAQSLDADINVKAKEVDVITQIKNYLTKLIS